MTRDSGLRVLLREIEERYRISTGDSDNSADEHTKLSLADLCSTMQRLHACQVLLEHFCDAFMSERGQTVLLSVSGKIDPALLAELRIDTRTERHCSFNLQYRRVNVCDFDAFNALLAAGTLDTAHPLNALFTKCMRHGVFMCDTDQKTTLRPEMCVIYDILTEYTHYHVSYDASIQTLYIMRLDAAVQHALQRALDRMYEYKCRLHEHVVWAASSAVGNDSDALYYWHRTQVQQLSHSLFWLDIERGNRMSYEGVMSHVNNFNQMLHRFISLYLRSLERRGKWEPLVLIKDVPKDTEKVCFYKEYPMREAQVCTDANRVHDKLVSLTFVDIARHRHAQKARALQHFKLDQDPYNDSVFSANLYNFVLAKVCPRWCATEWADKFWTRVLCNRDNYEVYTYACPSTTQADEHCYWWNRNAFLVRVRWDRIHQALDTHLRVLLHTYNMYLVVHALYTGMYTLPQQLGAGAVQVYRPAGGGRRRSVPGN